MEMEIANADVGYGKGIYRFDDLPLSSDGSPIQPGSDYNCRCIMRFVRSSVVEQTIASKKKNIQSSKSMARA